MVKKKKLEIVENGHGKSISKFGNHSVVHKTNERNRPKKFDQADKKHQEKTQRTKFTLFGQVKNIFFLGLFYGELVCVSFGVRPEEIGGPERHWASKVFKYYWLWVRSLLKLKQTNERTKRKKRRLVYFRDREKEARFLSIA